MLELILKIWVTPENVLDLLLQIALLAATGLIFHAWQEKWWKCLIPFYGTYVLYSHAWERKKWLFGVQVLASVGAAVSAWQVKRNVRGSVFDAALLYARTGELDWEVNWTALLLWGLLAAVLALVGFVLTRITYLKVCGSLGVENIFLKIGTFLLPEVFLLANYIVWARSQRK